MKLQIGDSVVAHRRKRACEEGQQVGIVVKTSDVSSDTYPNRIVCSITFPLSAETPVTFVQNDDYFWLLPDKSEFETSLQKIIRGEEVLWEVN